MLIITYDYKVNELTPGSTPAKITKMESLSKYLWT